MSDELKVPSSVIAFTRDELAAIFMEYCQGIRHSDRNARSSAYDKLTRAHNDMRHYGAVTIHVEGSSAETMKRAV